MKALLPGYSAILYFLLIHSVLTAQQLPITLYSSREGDPVAGAINILQDNQGWIWFANGYEIVRYDGHRFKSYPPTQQTKSDYVFGLMEVGDQKWVLGYPHTLKVSGDSMEVLDGIDPELKFQHMVVHNMKTYLLEQNGLYLYEKNTAKKICGDNSIKAGVDAELIPFNDSLLLTYGINGELIIFNLKNNSLSSISWQITDMQRDAGGSIILLLSGTGFYHLKNIRNEKSKYLAETEVYYSMPGTNAKLKNFVIDGSGQIWASEQLKRLVRISPQRRLTSFATAQGLPSLFFHDLFVDREGNLWIAFNTGIGKINTSLWERLTEAEGLVVDNITFMAKDGDLIFLGTQEGTNMYRNEKLSVLTQNGKPFICNSLLSENGAVWYSREYVLYTATLDEEHARVINEKTISKLPVRITELKKDDHGTLFIATVGGLYAWQRGQLLKPVPDSIHVRRMVIDKRNHIWLGEFTGPLHRYAIEYQGSHLSVKKILTVRASKEVPPLEVIRTLAIDKDENIVVGTRYNGLFHVSVQGDKVTTIKHFDTRDGLSSKSIWGLAISDNGKIWVSTAKGLNSMNYANGGWQVVDEGRQRNIYATLDVLFDAARRRIWVNNNLGVVYFDEAKTIRSYPFSVHLQVKTPLKTDPGDDEPRPRFSYKQNSFSFEFSSNSYLNEKAIQYTYRLLKKGDEQWSVPSANHLINFSSLNPGKYEFRVKALNANNEWSTNEAVYSFRILPPFWQRLWFIALSVSLVVAGIYAIYRYRIRKVKELFEIRQVIASDLHDEIGSSLTSIHILSKISQVNVTADQQKAHSLLEKVISQSEQIQQNMSDIVWAIRPDNDKMENMIMRMREYLNHSLEPKNIAVDFIAAEEIMAENLPMDKRRDLLLIFKEAVNNIARHSQCTYAHIRLDRVNENIRLLIEDDGKGFDVNLYRTSSGLKNMQRRAGLMKGSVNIASVIGKGTRVELTIPVT